jgi:hypothetical protein
MSILGLFGLGLALVAVYPLPFYIAAVREKRAMFVLGVVNLFFGWTCFGWLICLAWALTDEAPAKQ